MSKKMIKQGVYILKKESTPIDGVDFKANQELEVVDNIIYLNGFPLPFGMQDVLNSWMAKGLEEGLFINDTRS